MDDCLMGLSLAELAQVLADAGEPAFRAKQVYGWLQKGEDFAGMRNLPAALREKLAGTHRALGATILKTLRSEKDGTEKYLFSLHDGNLVEGVLMRYHYGNTLCISSQVGCRMGCAFCASTLEGRVRDLTAGEMMGQVLAVNRLHAEKDKSGVTNIVMMGSGEPLDNYENVIRFLRLVSAPEGIGVSLRNVSVSTCGLVPRIYDLARENLPITLSISLHAPTDEARQRIMPIAKTYSLEELLRACRDYVKAVGRRTSCADCCATSTSSRSTTSRSATSPPPGRRASRPSSAGWRRGATPSPGAGRWAPTSRAPAASSAAST